MAFPSYTYSFTNGSTADATQVNQNFTDILNGISDTTKDVSVNALTAAGTATLNGNVTLGNSSARTITFTGVMSSTLPIGANNLYDIGTVTSGGLRALYFCSAAAAHTTKLVGQTTSVDTTLTLPAITGTMMLYTFPTVQIFTTGSGTYTPAANVKYVVVQMLAQGGGGSGSGTSGGGAGTAGSDTTFNDWTAKGGRGGPTPGSAATTGSANTTGTGTVLLNILQKSTPASGIQSGTSATSAIAGPSGADSFWGGGGTGNVSTGEAGLTNTGGGGGAGGSNGVSNNLIGFGGGCGGFLMFIWSSPSAVSYAVGGAAGNAGGAGTSGANGGTGGSGKIVVWEFYG